MLIFNNSLRALLGGVWANEKIEIRPAVSGQWIRGSLEICPY